MRTKEQIEAEIYRIRHYGINSDQTDKSPAEDYADAVAEKRILEELEKELKQLENPLAQIKITEAPAIYGSLEEINTDLKTMTVWTKDTVLASVKKIIGKLQATIDAQRYICHNPIE